MFVIPDNDDPGREHARDVCRKLVGHCQSLRLRELPGLPAKRDFSDWADAGGMRASLTALCETAPEWSDLFAPVLVNLGSLPPKPVEWLWPGRIPLGKVTILSGDPNRFCPEFLRAP